VINQKDYLPTLQHNNDDKSRQKTSHSKYNMLHMNLRSIMAET